MFLKKRKYQISTLNISFSSGIDVEIKIKEINKTFVLKGAHNIEEIGLLINCSSFAIDKRDNNQTEYGNVVLEIYNEVFYEIFFDSIIIQNS